MRKCPTPSEAALTPWPSGESLSAPAKDTKPTEVAIAVLSHPTDPNHVDVRGVFAETLARASRLDLRGRDQITDAGLLALVLSSLPEEHR